jgi:hypothetical protein
MPDGWVTVVPVVPMAAGEPFPVPANCPFCGAPLTWIRTDDGPVYMFRCDRHGLIVLGTHGRFEQVPQ